MREAFARVGKLPDAPILPILAGNPYGYRNRITVLRITPLVRKPAIMKAR